MDTGFPPLTGMISRLLWSRALSEATEPETAERESMEFDVVIVGAGPAGLAAAIRLKQLAAEQGRETSPSCVIEKGSEVGAHILSGAVIDPVGAQRALARLERARRAGLRPKSRDDRFYYLRKTGGIRVPQHLHAAADEQSRLLYRQPRRIVPLARPAGRGAGRRDLSGLRRHRCDVRSPNGEVEGVITGDMGVARDGSHKHNYTPGIALARQIHAVRRRRARLARENADRKLGLDAEARPQKFGIGLKELWELPNGKHKPGLVQHTMGWPLDDHTGGGSFLYHFGDNLVSVGFVVHLDYRNPYSGPFGEFQRAKTHPIDPRACSKAASASPMARARSPKADSRRSRSSPFRAAR